jgi:hypothetical protein
MMYGGNRRDWGTGIAQKKFRVGSPTFFANPDINIPGLIDDMDGFSCSDSDDDDFLPGGGAGGSRKIDDNVAETEDVGTVRIEFRGRNLAEAIEDEAKVNERVETLARNRQEEQAMLSDLPWEIDGQSGPEPDLDQDVGPWMVLSATETFDRTVVVETLPLVDHVSTPVSLPQLSSGPELEDTDSKKAGGVLLRDNDVLPPFSFDYQPTLENSHGPSPSLLLQALTMSNSNDVINLGKLRFLYRNFPLENRLHI